jgi:hypothetical protein
MTFTIWFYDLIRDDPSISLNEITLEIDEALLCEFSFWNMEKIDRFYKIME